MSDTEPDFFTDPELIAAPRRYFDLIREVPDCEGAQSRYAVGDGFLVESHYVTGQTIGADGGSTML